MTHKIVITGIGASSPLGGTARDSWTALLAGESGASTLEHDWVEQYDLPVTFAAQAKVRPDTVLERPVAKRLDPSSQFALVAAKEAFADAGSPGVAPERLGVDFSTGIGGLWTLLDAWDTLREKGPRRVMPMTVPMLMPNAPSAAISMHFEARAYAQTVASACASSTEALVHAYAHLQEGIADVVIAGGSESAIHPMTLAAFSSMQALSRRNDDPAGASRPYDITRDGFVMGEGAAALVLETEEHALARGARIYAELAGGGVTADSYHITAPEPEGLGASRAVERALAAAGATADDVTHINAHATSTPVGDVAEVRAMHRIFGERIREIPVSATKAAHGHLLGGTGALEAVFTALALVERTAPPTINVTEQDPEAPLRISGTPMPLGEGPQLAISNSFGFGGHNAVIAIRSV
ncbi:beta-ketoacyl-[acyl-carrier-protein] synthase family protein [Agrococcus citreus]|uniref:3-oxoacyl-[acyl-carrier-protein] synthase 2 n=1 Tax=Agrococcus citreus TaxID=84643 RepID=A0ABN1YMK8_9MICO